MFKEVDRRLVTGLNGPMCFGTTQTTHHLRTAFDDCQPGAEMQSSTFLWSLHRVATEEVLRRQYTQGDNKSVHYVVSCVVVVRIGQHATLED